MNCAIKVVVLHTSAVVWDVSVRGLASDGIVGLLIDWVHAVFLYVRLMIWLAIVSGLGLHGNNKFA